MRSVAGAGDFRLLCSGLDEHTSASTVSSYRIVVLSERLMRAPESVIAAVAVHEAVHLRMSSPLPARLAEWHPDVTLLMETTAGQGTALNSKFEELAFVLEGCKGHPQLAVCLDTCHIFVAGYDIRTLETFTRTFADFERIIGFDRLKVVHCNDSKKGLGSRVDRHSNIGQGELGLEPFRLMVNDPRFDRIPILLETPAEDDGHEKDLATSKSLIPAPQV